MKRTNVVVLVMCKLYGRDWETSEKLRKKFKQWKYRTLKNCSVNNWNSKQVEKATDSTDHTPCIVLQLLAPKHRI